ncbi:hypothetical protein BNJ_00138 [Kaumoebavirus]|uniref:hypothetical protein n=1 Tax=Kaumoebavirus TaxID=1859492 RepID=UPI0009C1BC3A|nr:hypothetical protein BNJ_00138 [Kaumoebavirus]ARA71970.1 hypothetical protein BNJ_00138 [Kaumoebavirus]
METFERALIESLAEHLPGYEIGRESERVVDTWLKFYVHLKACPEADTFVMGWRGTNRFFPKEIGLYRDKELQWYINPDDESFEEQKRCLAILFRDIGRERYLSKLSVMFCKLKNIMGEIPEELHNNDLEKFLDFLKLHFAWVPGSEGAKEAKDDFESHQN